MAKKRNVEDIALKPEGSIEDFPVEHAIQEFMAEYSAAVIIDRAIPNIDGLKPVQRRLLYTMNNMGLVNSKHTKLNNIGGKAMILHPHGDPSASIYPMGAEWINNVPYVEIDGNGGTIVSGINGAAAVRYTGASLTKAAEKLMTAIKMNAVDMVPNYDGSTTEPELLPVEYPNVLMNATQGIAVGMSTNIIPHNPQEIMDAIIYYIDHQDAKPEKFAEFIKGPDFPTGGLLVDSEKANLRELTYGRTGKIDNNDTEGTNYVIRGEAKIIEDPKEPMIEFTSIPYGVTLDQLTESFNKFAEQNQALNMVDFRDETEDYDSIKLQIVFKKGTTKKLLEQALVLLYQKTKIESTISPNNLIIASGHPQTVSITNYFKEWLKFRKSALRRQFEFQLDKNKKRSEIVNGLVKLSGISDEVVADARKSKSKIDFKKILVKKYEFTENQSEAIATLQLYKLGKQDTEQLTKEKKQLDKDIKNLTKYLGSEKEFLKELKRQLQELRDTIFADAARKTKLVKANKVDKIEVDPTALIKEQDVLVVVKRDGIVQRMSQQVYDNNIDKYENRDKIVEAIPAKTTQGGLFLTKKGLAFYRLIDELENQNVRYDIDGAQKQIRSYKSDDETIGSAIFDLDKTKKTYIVSVTNQGMFKITRVSDVMPNTNTRAYFKRTTTYNGLKLKDDFVVKTLVLTEDELKSKSLEIKKNKGRRVTIELAKVNVQGASGSGSKKVNVKDDEQIVSAELV